jgi:hypothetical protein
MPELHLQRSGGTLDIILGEHKSSFPLADIGLNATTWEYGWHSIPVTQWP